MCIFRITFVLLGMTVIGTGCGRGAPERKADVVVTRDDESRIAYVDTDAPEMRAAMNKARSTVRQFIDALNNPKTTQSAFSVKMLVKEGEKGEHLWLVPVRYEKGVFIGTIDNRPDDLTTVKLGDEVEVEEDAISDWMFVDNGMLIGGYTLRRLRDTMSDEERSKFDESFSFKFE